MKFSDETTPKSDSNSNSKSASSRAQNANIISELRDIILKGHYSPIPGQEQFGIIPRKVISIDRGRR